MLIVMLPKMVGFAAPMIAAGMQVDSDPFFQTEMRLVAPFAEMLMTALMVWKIRKLLKEIAPV